MERIKIATVVAIGVLCLVGGGCGHNNEARPAPPQFEPPVVQYDDISYQEVEELDIDDSFTDDDVTYDDISTDETTEDATTMEGIIVLETDWRGTAMNRNIYCLDASTGEATLLCTFPCNEMGTSAQGGYCFRINPELRRYVNFYDMFDAEYTKAILTKDLKNGNTHAGWIDRDGAFFDVTEELDEQPGDFEDPIEWRSVGFQGDTFIYAKATHDNMNPYEYYGVDINNLAPGASWPIDLADKQILAKLPDNNSYGYNFYRPSSWIDDVWFYGEEVTLYGPYESVKFNSQTGESQQYIPGSSRYNWSAVGSPDGQRVAFLSTPKDGQSANIGLYVMPANGGDPQKVQTNIFYDYAGAGLSTVPQVICPLYVSYHILEWK